MHLHYVVLGALSTPGTSAQRYPYLLRGRSITEVNDVWSTDITYIRLQHGFLYLVAVLDWYSRYVLGLGAFEHARHALLPGKRTWHLHGIWAQMRANFPAVPYRQRTLIESVFSATKRTRSARAAGRSSATQQTQALLLGIAFTVYRLRLRRHFALLLP